MKRGQKGEIAAFIELVEFMGAPAVLVSLHDKTVIHANSRLLKKHGKLFQPGSRLDFKNFKTLNSHSLSGLELRKKQPIPQFAKSSLKNARLEFVKLNDSYALILEKTPAPEPLKLNEQSGLDKKSGRRLHFSYLYNFMTNKWAYCTENAIFEKLGKTLGADLKKDFDWKSVIHPDDRALYDNTIMNLRQHGGDHEIHYRIICSNGEILNVKDYCALTAPEAGKWPVLIGTVIYAEKSYSEMHQAEHQILQGRLVSGMVHDFKNLLGGIQNIVEWAASKSSGNPEVAHALNKTLSYTDKAAKLISSTLKLNSAKEDGKTERIYINSIISDMEEIIRRALPSSSTLKIKMKPGIPPVYGQRCMLQDMILNLCVNARDAMKEKGDCLKLELDQKNIRDENGKQQQFIRLRIADNGCGMSKSVQNSIFDAFYSTKDHGAGLGLWMVRETVKSFDGKINVLSTPGKGTCFEILFPVINQEVEGSIPEAENLVVEPVNKPGEMSKVLSFNKEKRRTILFIEDEPLIRGSVSIWLESLGFKILESGDGLEGLGIFQDKHKEIDLVIQDYVLPGKKGDELLEDLKKCDQNIPVIVSSANPDEDKIAMLKQKGAHAFLPKPFRMEELLRLLVAIFKI